MLVMIQSLDNIGGIKMRDNVMVVIGVYMNNYYKKLLVNSMTYKIDISCNAS